MRIIHWLIVSAAFVGCNANLKVKTSGVESDASFEVPEEEVAEETPVVPDFVGEFAFASSYIQSRSIILLQLNSDLLEQGEKFSLWNETTNLKLLDSDQASLAFTDGKIMAVAGGYSLYDLAPAGYSGKMAYGVNNFRLDIGDEYAPRYGTATMILRDFTIFELALTNFGENVETKSNFQGWINTVSQPVVNAQGSILTVGMPNIVNR